MWRIFGLGVGRGWFSLNGWVCGVNFWVRYLFVSDGSWKGGNDVLGI